MRPDRVISGECRGAEALDMLQAMNTGHDGSMTTVHANNTRDALGRLEVMIAMAGFDLPVKGLRTQISSAINIVVQARRLTGGKRKVVSVSEITGMEGDLIQMHDLFTFEQRGADGNGHAFGFFRVHGIRPKCADRIEHRGLRLGADLFARRDIESVYEPQRFSEEVTVMESLYLPILIAAAVALLAWGLMTAIKAITNGEKRK